MSRPVHNQDPRLAQLRAALRRVEARFRLLEAVRLAPIAVALALLATLTVAFAGWASPRVGPATVLLCGGVFVAAALLTTSLYALLRPRDLMATARRADRLLSLDERLSTALETAAGAAAQGVFPAGVEGAPPGYSSSRTEGVQGRSPAGVEGVSPGIPLSPSRTDMGPGGLRDAQLDDALSRAAALPLRTALPAQVNTKSLIPAGLLLLAVAAVLIAPNPYISQGERAVQAQVTDEQKKIEAVKQAVQADPRLGKDPSLQALLKELATLSQDLGTGKLSREEAMARISQAEGDLQKSLNPQAEAQRQALDQLARQLAASQNPAAKEAGQALQSGDTAKSAAGLDKLASDASKLSPEERAALSRDLAEARDSLAALDPELAQRLNDASTALDPASGSKDPKAAEDALKELSKQVEERSNALDSQRQIEQALSQMQESKQNIAQAGQTPQATNSTAVAQVSSVATAQMPAGGTAQPPGTTPPGTAVASQSSPAPGTTVSGSPMALGSPQAGTPAATGTAVAIPGSGQGTPGPGGTPVAGQGQGAQGQPAGQGGSQQSQGSSATSGNTQATGPGGQQGWGTGHQEPVYAPSSSLNPSATLTPVRVQGQDNLSGEQSSTTTDAGQGSKGGAQVPYEQVYGQYKEQAGNALKGDYIPQGYKDLVRDYFTQIEPQQP